MHKQAVSLKHRIVTKEFLQNLYTVTNTCVDSDVCEKVCPAGCFSAKTGRAAQNPTGCIMLF